MYAPPPPQGTRTCGHTATLTPLAAGVRMGRQAAPESETSFIRAASQSSTAAAGRSHAAALRFLVLLPLAPLCCG